MQINKRIVQLLIVIVLLVSSTITVLAVDVYITNTGSKYHESNCRYLRESKIKVSLDNAKYRGYDACSVCDPPINDTTTKSANFFDDLLSIFLKLIASIVILYYVCFFGMGLLGIFSDKGINFDTIIEAVQILFAALVFIFIVWNSILN